MTLKIKKTTQPELVDYDLFDEDGYMVAQIRRTSVPHGYIGAWVVCGGRFGKMMGSGTRKDLVARIEAALDNE